MEDSPQFLDKYIDVLENIQVKGFLLDDDGTCVYVDDVVAEIFGFSSDTFVGRDIGDILDDIVKDSDKADEYIQIIESVLKHQRSSVEFSTRCRGDVILNVRLSCLEDGGEVFGVFGVLSDITEKRNLGFELERYKAIVQAGGDPVYTLDSDGCFTFINEALEDLTGYSREELIGEYPSIIMDEEDIDNAEELIIELLKTDKERETIEIEILTKDGGRIPTEAHIALLPFEDEFRGTTGFIRNITERKKLEQNLKQSNRVLESLYRISADNTSSFEEKLNKMLDLGTYFLDLPYGFLTDISEDTQTIIESKGDHELLQKGSSCPLSKAYCRKTIETEEGWLAVQNASMEGWEDDPAYELFKLGCYIGSKVVVDDDLYGTLCFADSKPKKNGFSETERLLVELMAQWISYELQKQKTTENLRKQNNRLEQFASIVSHDLRNPLNVVKLNLDNIKKKTDTKELTKIENSIDRMNTLIDDLLMLAREGQKIENIEFVDLKEIIENCWKSVSTKNAELIINTEKTIKADKSRLKQLLENLFRNSIEHNKESISVQIGDIENGIYIEDNGKGIPKNKQEKVFEGGYTTTEEGTGFGLSIVKEIVEGHNWDIKIKETEKGGTRFEITGIETKK